MAEMEVGGLMVALVSILMIVLAVWDHLQRDPDDHDELP